MVERIYAFCSNNIYGWGKKKLSWDFNFEVLYPVGGPSDLLSFALASHSADSVGFDKKHQSVKIPVN